MKLLPSCDNIGGTCGVDPRDRTCVPTSTSAACPNAGPASICGGTGRPTSIPARAGKVAPPASAQSRCPCRTRFASVGGGAFQREERGRIQSIDGRYFKESRDAQREIFEFTTRPTEDRSLGQRFSCQERDWRRKQTGTARRYAAADPVEGMERYPASDL